MTAESCVGEYPKFNAKHTQDGAITVAATINSHSELLICVCMLDRRVDKRFYFKDPPRNRSWSRVLKPFFWGGGGEGKWDKGE